MSKTTFTVADDKKTLTVERTFDAPKEKVWAAYTKADLLQRWWGPRGWKTTIKHMEFVDGGYWHYGMTCEDKSQGDWFGKTSWGKAHFANITPQNSFEYTDAFCDENGDPIPDMPVSRTLLTMSEVDGKTRIVIRTEYDTPEALAQVLAMGMEQGLTETLDNLENVLAEHS